MPRRLAPILLALTLAAPAAAQEVSVSVVDHGIYDVTVTGRRPAPEHVAQEYNLIAGVRLEQETRDIPAILGRSFGYQFRVDAPSGTRLTLRSFFPGEGLTNPDTGQTARVENREIVTAESGTKYYDGYRFDRSWEMAEGIWVFQVLHKGRVLTEQRFRVHVLVN